MARRPMASSEIKNKELSALEVRQGISRLNQRLEEVQSFDPTSVKDQNANSDLAGLSASIDEALSRTFGQNTPDYMRYSDASYFDRGPFNALYETPIQEVHRSLSRSKEASIALLRSAIKSLQERLDEMGSKTLVGSESISTKDYGRRVFIVHGHDDGMKNSVARFLEKIEFEPIILHEQANKGHTVIEKIEANNGVGFAIILLSPDDEGRKINGDLKPRARQNVMLELGYFIGKLNRNRVCALKRGEIEIPSDFGGIVYENFDDAGAWQSAVGRELQAAGYEIDWNVVMRKG